MNDCYVEGIAEQIKYKRPHTLNINVLRIVVTGMLQNLLYDVVVRVLI